MDISDKIEINKRVRSYVGDNSFLLSIKKQLATSKYLSKEKIGNKTIRVLSEKQYDVVLQLLDQS